MVTLIYYLISFLIQPLKIVHWLEPAVINQHSYSLLSLACM